VIQLKSDCGLAIDGAKNKVKNEITTSKLRLF